MELGEDLEYTCTVVILPFVGYKGDRFTLSVGSQVDLSLLTFGLRFCVLNMTSPFQP